MQQTDTGILAAIITGCATVAAQLVISSRTQKQTKDQHESTIARVQQEQDKSLALIRKDIEQLKERQDRHNNIMERTILLEAAVKAEHERLDRMEKKGI